MVWLSHIELHLPTKNPHILVALHRITNSQHAVLETSFQWARFLRMAQVQRDS